MVAVLRVPLLFLLRMALISLPLELSLFLLWLSFSCDYSVSILMTLTFANVPKRPSIPSIGHAQITVPIIISWICSKPSLKIPRNDHSEQKSYPPPCGIDIHSEKGPQPSSGTVLVSSCCCNKTPHLWVLKDRKLLSHGFRGWKSQIKKTMVLVSPETSFLGLQVATSWMLYPYMVKSLCLQRHLPVPLPILTRRIDKPSILNEGLVQCPFQLQHLFKDLIAK